MPDKKVSQLPVVASPATSDVLPIYSVATGDPLNKVTVATLVSSGLGIPTAGQLPVGNAGGTAYAATTLSGDATLASTGVVTLASIIAAAGPVGSATVVPVITYDAKGRLTTVTTATIAPAVGSITGLGTGVATALAVNTNTAGGFSPIDGTTTFTNKTINGASNTLTVRIANDVSGLGTSVATALGVNVGSVGAFMTLNGAGGTPSSLTLTNATGLPISTGVSGLGAGTASALTFGVGTTSGVVIFNGPGGTPNSMTGTNISGTAASLTAGAVTGFTAGAGVLTGPASAGVAETLGNNETITGAKIFNNSTGTTFSGNPIVISGNISAATWTTNGVRIKGTPGTLTDTTAATGTTATAYTDVLGGNTIAATNASVVFTNYFTQYNKDPVAGTNVTLTNKWAVGGDSMKIGTSNQLTVSNAGVLTLNAAAVLGTPTSIALTNATSLSDGALSSNVPLKNASNTFTASQLVSLNQNAQTSLEVRNTTSGTGAYTSVFATSDGSNLAAMYAVSTGYTGIPAWAGNAVFYSGTNLRVSAGTASGVIKLQTGGLGTANDQVTITSAGAVLMPNLGTDAAQTDSSLCWKTSDGTLLRGTGTLGICLGTSSERFKHGIEELTDGLNRILALTPVSYIYNSSKEEKRLYGFTAERTAREMPEVVSMNEEGQPNSVDMVGMLPFLVNAVKELWAQNQVLAARCQTLAAAIL